MRLNKCQMGSKGTVSQMNARGPVGQRLMEMGLIEGAKVKVIRVAPLGDPLQVEVDDYRLSLRMVEAAQIEVALESEVSP